MKQITLGLLTLLGLTMDGGVAHAQVVKRAWEKPIKIEGNLEADPESIEAEGLGDVAVQRLMDRPTTLTEAMAARVKVLVYRMPQDFDYEFALLVVDGKIRRAFVISTAMPGKEPITGVHRLVVPRLNGKPWPWRTSITYFNSPMYWALQVSGGYFIHSSPHYGNLGAPASMGCMRTSIPDAMELFNTVANEFAGSASYIIIHEGMQLSRNSDPANGLLKALNDSGMTVDQLKEALKGSKAEVEAVSRGDLEYAPGVPADAHVRPFSNLVQAESSFPKCAGVSCWEFFKKDRTTIRLKPFVVSRNPSVDSYTSPAGALAVTSPIQLSLSSLVGDSIRTLDPYNINDVRLKLKAGSAPLLIRVCDTVAMKCSKARGPTNGTEGEFIYPMYQIAEQLKSSANLILNVQSGNGSITGVTVRYFR